MRRRARDIGLIPGSLPCGSANAITDVAGVRVGHSTIVRGDGALSRGEGPVRTGVTVVLPHGGDLYEHKVRAAVHTINGYGKVIGFEQVRELGTIESPIALTNTLNVGLVADALIQIAIEQGPSFGIDAARSSLNVVVGETNDSFLNDISGRHVRYEHVRAAYDEARWASDGHTVQVGAVGAGTGTSCYGWKGGIGTSSRRIASAHGGYTVGALVQSNFGRAEELVVLGVPIGRSIRPAAAPEAVAAADGSVVVVLATDAPLSERQLRRLCVRAVPGLARTGSALAHGSGDFVIAFTTADPVEHRPAAHTRHRSEVADEPVVLGALFPAVIDAVEEAVLDSLCAAETVVGRDGHVRAALPIEEVVALVDRCRRA